MSSLPDVVTLVIPPSVFLLDERVFVTLGILRVAAVLEGAGVKVEMLDLSGIENFENAARDHARRTASRHFGITITTPQLPATRALVETIRTARADAKIILGGPHVTLVNAAAKRERKDGRVGRAHGALEVLYQLSNVLVAGDGEEAVFLALQNESPRLVDADDPKSPLFLTNERLTALPWPARHLVDLETYRYKIDGVRATSLIAQLGCPFECGFCGGRLSPALRRVRTRPTENIVSELEFLACEYRLSGFMLYDDELNVNKEMVSLMKAIRAKQEELGMEWRLRGFIKSQLFTEEQAEAMYEAGFRWILVGFESGSPRILTNINKKSTREENTRCLEIAHRAGLKVKALMSLGHPGESAETIRETRDWLLETRPDDFDVTIITTYPGTPYYDNAVPLEDKDGVWVYTYPKTGDKLFSMEVDFSRVAEYYKGKPGGGYTAYVYTETLSPKRLVELRDWVESDVREKLGIPFNPGAAAIRYEHSMGQLPLHILRTTA